jgi:hypothetical protein
MHVAMHMCILWHGTIVPTARNTTRKSSVPVAHQQQGDDGNVPGARAAPTRHHALSQTHARLQIANFRQVFKLHTRGVRLDWGCAPVWGGHIGCPSFQGIRGTCCCVCTRVLFQQAGYYLTRVSKLSPDTPGGLVLPTHALVHLI